MVLYCGRNLLKVREIWAFFEMDSFPGIVFEMDWASFFLNLLLFFFEGQFSKI